MNIIFAGTPQFAIPSLQAVIAHHNLLAVITQKDKKANRGQKLVPTPVRQFLLWRFKENPPFPILTEHINNLSEALKRMNPDIIVVVAYGEIIGKPILTLAHYGVINIHPSLLPRYRGASPIQAAILGGDKETGVSIIEMSQKLDAGPIIFQEKITIEKQDTALSLHNKLSKLSANLLIQTLANLSSLKPQPQNDALATYTEKFTTHDAELYPKEKTEVLERKIRAYNPWPGAYLKIQNYSSKFKITRLKIFAAEIKKGALSNCRNTPYIPLHIYENYPAIVCGDGKVLILTEVQPEGKERMKGEEFVRGYCKNSKCKI